MKRRVKPTGKAPKARTPGGAGKGSAGRRQNAGRGWPGLLALRQAARRAKRRRLAYAGAGGKTPGGAGPALIRSDTA